MQNTGKLSPYRSLFRPLTFAPGCRNATLVSALNSEDAVTHNILNGLFTLPYDIMQAAFASSGPKIIAYDFLRAFNISQVLPVDTGSIIGPTDCLAACQNYGVYNSS